MNKFMHDNLSTPKEREKMRARSIKPRVVGGRTYHEKVNTCIKKVDKHGATQ